MHPLPHLRIARPTDQLAAVVAFYRDGLGFAIIGQFVDHDGFDGVILGHAGAGYHLEFTSQSGHQAGRAPTADNLLVFYLPDEAVWQGVVDGLIAHGCAAVPASNPYWDRSGLTFEDPDGYRVVLQRGAWTLALSAAPDSLTLRLATAADIPAMSAIRLAVRENRLSDPTRITRKMYEDYLDRLGRSWVAEADGQLIGFASAAVADSSIWALFVSPEHEGHGAGKALLKLATDWLFQQGAETITLGTAANTRADRFYAAQGWARGEMKDAIEVEYTLPRSAAGKNGGAQSQSRGVSRPSDLGGKFSSAKTAGQPAGCAGAAPLALPSATRGGLGPGET